MHSLYCIIFAGAVSLRNSYFGGEQRNKSILLDDLTCHGTEYSLLMCSSTNSSTVVPFLNNCKHNEVAGVICNSEI